MNKKIDIKERKSIWLALSEFYLDTELQDSDFRYIASKISESPYSIEEVKKINKYEIFPVLQVNLLSVAGVWSGFQEEWLVDKISDSLNKRNAIKRFGIECAWYLLKGMQLDYWEKLQKAYVKLQMDTES